MSAEFASGSVHGRFQPIHNGHMEYLLAAKARCQYLWIGITAYEDDIRSLRDTPRESPENNPLTYFERVRLITLALLGAGIDARDFGFVPFPIEAPEKLPNYLDLAVPCFTTICEPWNREKIRILEAIGYSVIVLYERAEKAVTGNMIRDDLKSGGGRWRTLVPERIVSEIEALGLHQRLSELRNI